MDILRGLVLLVLGVGVAGFGLCSLLAGAMGVATLMENTQGSGDWASVIFVCAGIGAALAGLCWWGFRKVRAKAAPVPDVIDAA